MTNPIVIGIDAGGTMTDTILVDEHGHFKIGKAATTPRNEAEGFIASAADAAEAWGISLEQCFSGVEVVLYSGTGMLNTLLSRTGRKLGLITTKLGQLESQDALLRRIDEASKYVPLEDLALSPQCGFASMEQGNLLSWDDQQRKLDVRVGGQGRKVGHRATGGRRSINVDHNT